ncbi:hypothetical protein BV898_01554 [Hypsibius exemplaris]|uniref:Glycoside hydrolase family 19 catalytic domain-containing protein n=1 Tax=Hypsibius exemplaris TaxID=2072580 RepID=A0A1W0XB14_HYPEX|nr:hypothetical protein BV898_01554 [Hypsibius exemplaris]
MSPQIWLTVLLVSHLIGSFNAEEESTTSGVAMSDSVAHNPGEIPLSTTLSNPTADAGIRSQDWSLMASTATSVTPFLSSPFQGPNTNLITKEEFVNAVTSVDASYPIPTDEQYNIVVSRAKSAGRITTKLELAMFLAEIIYSSHGLVQKRAGNPTNFTYSSDLNVPGKEYYARGYINLAWAFNYLKASLALYGNDRLLQNPDLVETDDQVSWEVSFWYWLANVHVRPGVRAGRFGTTIDAINGAHECGPDASHPEWAAARFAVYTKVFAAFNLPGTPDSRGC